MKLEEKTDSIMSLYVGNLHPDCTEVSLFEVFSPLGQILCIRLCRDTTTKASLGYAYVNYVNKEDAEKAIGVLSFEHLKGRPMRIMWAEKNVRYRLLDSANLFVKNLDQNIDDRILKDIFSSFGNILSLKVATDENGLSKGYGFVQFETDEEAKTALDKTHEKLISGKKVYVAKFIPRDERRRYQESVRYKNIYLKNFTALFSDEDLKNLCQRFGAIRSSKVMEDEEGKSKGFGFVAFEESESAKEAVAELNGLLLNGKVLYVGRAKKKSERREEIQRNFQRKLKAEVKSETN